MCGILGVVGPRSFGPEGFGRALDVMANRGPDDRGVYEEPECLLGQRRLAVLDLSAAGRQPMASADGRYLIVSNGEVYNFGELRRALESEGACFTSRTDTEVILAHYAKEGPACLDRFRGMFAIAIWDRQEKSLFLARDRMGIKPLYVWMRPEGLAFASEVKALRALPGGPNDIDPEAVVHYLAWGHVPAPLAFTKGVECVMPATWLLWRRGRTTTRAYWDFPAVPPEGPAREGGYLYRTREQALEALRPLLREAVAYRCISDAPLGAFLSGGIDSSAVVSLMRAAGQERLHTISVSFPQAPLDESAHAADVAARFGTIHRSVPISADAAAEEREGFFAAMDQPTCDGFNTYVVSKHARQAGLTVSLSGLGGDELFAGYTHVHRLMAAERWLGWVPEPAIGAAALGASRLSRRLAKLEALKVPGPPLARLYYAARGLFAPSQIRSLVHPDVLAQTSVGKGDWSSLLPPPALLTGGDGPRRSPFHSISVLELRRYLHNQLLRDSDVFGLAHALEIRVPLIDHKVLEAVFRTAPGVVLGSPADRMPKRLLVDSLSAALPEACVNRPKMGFTFPFADWLRTSWGAAMDRHAADPGNMRHPALLVQSGVDTVWNQFRQGDLHWSRPWALHVLGVLAARATGAGF